MVIESALSNGDHARSSDQFVEQCARFVVELLGFVGMHAHCCKHARIGGRQLHGSRVARNAVTRTDRDERIDARFTRAIECSGAVDIEFARHQMAVAVEPHD